eukprot:c20382_g1_i1.p1 GENE.c20382_g1_i1~~c20382_g1_i1.p1  ORF type:complete len:407 (+),score=82.01 c20382_g1_i1:65-1222(+)
MADKPQKSVMAQPLIYSSAMPPSTVYVPVAGANSVPPPPTGCNSACTIIMFVVAFGFSTPGLIWSQFWQTGAILQSFTFVMALVALCSNKHHSGLLRPLAFVSLAQAILFAASALMTYKDYRDKCTHRTNLADRDLQNAYAFDCEWGVILIALWTVGIVISIILFSALAGVAFCTVSAYDRYQQVKQNAGIPLVRSWTIPPVVGTILGVTMVTILFVVMMVGSFQGHKTGKVDGECAAGSDFFSQPEYNDLGCCRWTAKHGTCCQQSACENKQTWWDTSTNVNATTSGKCDDLFGLLSCSACHTDAGHYATSFSNITICESFCNQLHDNCCVDCTRTATAYCTQELQLIVVPDSFAPYCFNASPTSCPAIALFVAVLVSIALLLF